MATDELERRRAWKRDGFFVVRGRVRAEQLRELSEACDHVLDQVRSTAGPRGHLSTHVSDLLAPEYFAGRLEARTRLADFMSSRDVVALIHDLGRPSEGLPNVRDTQYFHEPTVRDSDGAWHRDGGVPGASDAPETRSTLLRFRIAFAHDDHLEYVPGSHARPDTPEERDVIQRMARNRALASGAIRIELEPGDVCVFDTWGIHRARYRRDRIRRTLDLLFGFGPKKRVDYGAFIARVMRAT